MRIGCTLSGYNEGRRMDHVRVQVGTVRVEDQHLQCIYAQMFCIMFYKLFCGMNVILCLLKMDISNLNTADARKSLLNVTYPT